MGLGWNIYETDIYHSISSYIEVHKIRAEILKLTIIFLQNELFISKKNSNCKECNEKNENVDSKNDSIKSCKDGKSNDNTNNDININDTNNDTNSDDININDTNNVDVMHIDYNDDTNSDNLVYVDHNDDVEDNIELEKRINQLISWLNSDKIKYNTVNMFSINNFLSSNPITYNNIPTHIPLLLIRYNLSGIYWFINMSDCDGIYSVGQVIDMKNAFEILHNFYYSNTKNEEGSFQIENHVKSTSNTHIYDINQDTLEYALDILYILRKAVEYDKPILQC